MSLLSLIFSNFVFVGIILHGIALFTPYWMVKDPEDTFRDDIFQHAGIWIRCTTFVTGNFDCDDYNRALLGLPMEIVVGRLLGVFGFVIGVVSSVLLLLSLDFFNLSKTIRKWLKFSGGLLGFLSGLSFLIISGMFASRILDEYWFQTNQQLYGGGLSRPNRNIFGWSLFVGWAGAFLEIVFGIILAIAGLRMNSSYRQPRNPYNTYPGGVRNNAYRPEQPAPIYNKEYV